jgi:hypothetical protein
MNRKFSSQNLEFLEVPHASGVERALPTLESLSLIARVQNGNYRLSEAMLAASGEKADLLTWVRTQIGRGDLDAAEPVVLRFLQDPAYIHVHSDLDLELARIYFQKCSWLHCIETANRALLREETTALGRLTLLQVRSHSWFELGDWNKSLVDLDRVQSLRTLFLQAQAAFYSDVLRVKVTARLSGPTAAGRMANRLEKNIFGDSSVPGADPVLTLLRLRSDLSRLEGTVSETTLLASFWIAQAMGDGIYSGLALLDLAGHGSRLSISAAPLLETFLSRHLKLRILQADCQLYEPESTAGRTLAFPITKVSTDRSEYDFETPPEFLFFLEWQVRLHLPSLEVTRTKIQSRSAKILKALSNGPCERAKLFEDVWSLSYRAESHDVILRNALHRLRRQAGIEICSTDGQIALKNAMAIL